MITLTPRQLWDLLTHNCDAIDSVSLVRYPEIVAQLTNYLGDRDSKMLFERYGLFLDLRQPSHPVLWRGDAWLEEVKRSSRVNAPAAPTKKQKLREALIATGLAPDGVDVMIGFLNKVQLEQFYAKHQIV